MLLMFFFLSACLLLDFLLLLMTFKLCSRLSSNNEKNQNLKLNETVNSEAVLPPLLESTIYQKEATETLIYQKDAMENSIHGKETFECPVCFETYSIDDGMIRCVNYEDKGNDENSHGVCIDCIRGHAKCAIFENPVAFGGVGLPCVHTDCKNILLMCKLNNSGLIISLLISLFFS